MDRQISDSDRQEPHRRATAQPRAGCLCCGAKSWQNHLVAQSLHGHACSFARCRSCSLVVLDDPLDAQALADAYDENYYGGGLRKFVGGLHGVRVHHAATRATRVSRLRGPAAGRIFDVGCGEGLFLKAMLDRGWSVDGNEVGATALKRAQTLTGTPLSGRDLLGLHLEDGAYGAVTLWQVFEHLGEPVETLQRLHRMLKPGGLLAVSVPNAESWQARLFGPSWLHLDPPRHLHVFNPSNLSALLRKHGFEPFLQVGNPLEFGPIGYVQSTMNALGIRRDAFFELLKTKEAGGQAPYLRGMMLVGLAAALTPPAVIMSLIEAAGGHSGTFELYAWKRETTYLPGR